MGMFVRKDPMSIAFALVVAHNNNCDSIAKAGSLAHGDMSSIPAGGDYLNPTVQAPLQITAANGDGTLATLRTLALDIYNVYVGPDAAGGHLADAYAHKIADAPPVLVKPTAADALATIQTFLNAVKVDYEAHRASTTFHQTADATNTITSANATDQATSDTLANELKTDINAHIKFAPAGGKIRLV